VRVVEDRKLAGHAVDVVFGWTGCGRADEKQARPVGDVSHEHAGSGLRPLADWPRRERASGGQTEQRGAERDTACPMTARHGDVSVAGPALGRAGVIARGTPGMHPGNGNLTAEDTEAKSCRSLGLNLRVLASSEAGPATSVARDARWTESGAIAEGRP
jgi:hypothetical protein